MFQKIKRSLLPLAAAVPLNGGDDRYAAQSVLEGAEGPALGQQHQQPVEGPHQGCVLLRVQEL